MIKIKVYMQDGRVFDNDVVVVKKSNEFHKEGDIGVVKGTGEYWGYDYEVQVDVDFVDYFDSHEIEKIGEL